MEKAYGPCGFRVSWRNPFSDPAQRFHKGPPVSTINTHTHKHKPTHKLSDTWCGQVTEVYVNILLEEITGRLITRLISQAHFEAFSRKWAKITQKLNHCIICHLTHFKLQKVLSRLLAEFRDFNVLLAIFCSLTLLFGPQIVSDLPCDWNNFRVWDIGRWKASYAQQDIKNTLKTYIAITQVFSVTWSFRNHYSMLSWFIRWCAGLTAWAQTILSKLEDHQMLRLVWVVFTLFFSTGNGVSNFQAYISCLM